MGQVQFLTTVFGVRLRQKGDKNVCLYLGKHVREERREGGELGILIKKKTLQSPNFSESFQVPHSSLIRGKKEPRTS